jgi:hypothetical protein
LRDNITNVSFTPVSKSLLITAPPLINEEYTSISLGEKNSSLKADSRGKILVRAKQSGRAEISISVNSAEL